MRTFLSIAALLTLAGCMTPRPAPMVKPAPVVTPVSRPTPIPVPLAADWNDWPFTPGDWRYLQQPGSSAASFGAGAETRLTLRCDRFTHQVQLAGIRDAAVTVRTTSMTRTIAPTRVAGESPYAVTLAVNDPLLDAIAFSRGRFVIQQNGPPLVLPPYAEIGRVIEDCRG
ncbi:hypothetical protein [Sphingomonas sp.]|uniref:hypothetical protein n=1 Tax=Sphingomonas sp. TaxID=28214 RepID=UPI002E356422|nr:hypothetical protein [Sphingomonas sp.]HEX4696025.1 hypothetical protein [Sphingomonas sp.]